MKTLSFLGAILMFASCAIVRPCKQACRDLAEMGFDAQNPNVDEDGFVNLKKMTLVQLQTEKNEIGIALKNSLDSSLFRIMNSPGYELFDSEYDSLASIDNDYQANGKLKRFERRETTKRLLAGKIRDCPNALLFNRFRKLRLQLATGEYFVPVSKKVIRKTEKPVIDENVDSLWVGLNGINGNPPIPNPEKFTCLEACLEWGNKKADAFRNNSFSFGIECRRKNESIKKKLW